jgi:hypothetical protein
MSTTESESDFHKNGHEHISDTGDHRHLLQDTAGLFLGKMWKKKAWSPAIFQMFTQGTSSSQVFEEITAIRAALLWFSHHPQFMPIFHTISKYATHHVLTSCLSSGACRNCQRCLHSLGWDIDRVGSMELCESILMSTYAEALHDPLYSLQMANKGISLVHQAIDDMAAMPEMADHYHTLLAKHLMSIKDQILSAEDGIMKLGSPQDAKDAATNKKMNKNAGISTALLDSILKRGGSIYKQTMGQKAIPPSWLYVGLPEILARIRAEGMQDERKIADIINHVYHKWHQWGKEKSPIIKAQATLPKTDTTRPL